MADAAAQAHTFKLVLVGDGGTGKVSEAAVRRCWHPSEEDATDEDSIPRSRSSSVDALRAIASRW
jgi:hypothetical protein